MFSDADIRVLKLLQSNLDAPKNELAEAAGMSPSTLWRRMNELQTVGAIRKRVALLDPDILGFPICVFLSVNLIGHDKPIRDGFEAFVTDTPEILECFSITGGFDYMLIVRSASVAAFETFLMDKILGHQFVATATSQISMRQHKYTTELPL
ncbi:MAG: Lrp/AsnC family transcriptional regulator [Pseudomonadota bacterium]